MIMKMFNLVVASQTRCYVPHFPEKIPAVEILEVIIIIKNIFKVSNEGSIKASKYYIYLFCI